MNNVVNYSLSYGWFPIICTEIEHAYQLFDESPEKVLF